MLDEPQHDSQDRGSLAKWETVANRFDTLSHQLSDPAVLSQPPLLVSLTKERAEIEEAALLFGSYRHLLEEMHSTERMLGDTHLDPELRPLAEEELESLRDRQK